MIIDRPDSHFIFIVCQEHYHDGWNYIRHEGKPLTNKEYLENWGKWIVLGPPEELHRLAEKIDPFVENKSIPAAKYDRQKIEAFELGECVMCVYCDFRQREEVWQILESVGVADKMWVFEKETMERWLPGGRLLEKWIEGKGLSPEEADKVRANAEETFKKMFADEDAEFTGVMQ